MTKPMPRELYTLPEVFMTSPEKWDYTNVDYPLSTLKDGIDTPTIKRGVKNSPFDLPSLLHNYNNPNPNSEPNRSETLATLRVMCQHIQSLYPDFDWPTNPVRRTPTIIQPPTTITDGITEWYKYYPTTKKRCMEAEYEEDV